LAAAEQSTHVSESEPGGRAGFGLFGSLRSALGNVLELAHTRLELLSVEMEALTLLIVFWDTHRLLAACAITAFFTILAIAAALVVRQRVRERPRLLAATIGELKRDADALHESIE